MPAPDPGYDEAPLALLYAQALSASRHERARLLRVMGDSALFVSGFFADSLNRTLVDLAYYRAMGGQAYARLSREEASLGYAPDVFEELSGRFTEFADVLSEVSEASRLVSDRSVLQLYERWVQTGSRRAAVLLAERGIAPVGPGDGRRIDRPAPGPPAGRAAAAGVALRAGARRPPSPTSCSAEEEAAAYPGGGSRTLVTQDGDQVSLGVVLERETFALLAGADPRVRLDHGNLGAFCTLTEEVSHFVYLHFCARASRSVTQLELELQAEVDKYLTAVFLLCLQNEGAVSPRLRDLLFRRYRLAAPLSAEQAERYRAASVLAYRYCSCLESRYLRAVARLADLAREARRFYRLGQREKLERIADLRSAA